MTETCSGKTRAIPAADIQQQEAYDPLRTNEKPTEPEPDAELKRRKSNESKFAFQ